MKAYKGFNKDMTCRGFRYEEGKEYETDKAKCCKTGFHACEDPLDCFGYYKPSKSEYHEVECNGEIDRNDGDSKFACTKIKVGGKLNIAGIVKATLEYRKEKVKSATGSYRASSATEDYGASSVTGRWVASSVTGNCGVSSVTGCNGASSVTGDYSASSVTGNCGVSSATGDFGVSNVIGDYGISSATGNFGVSSVTGNCGISSVTGDYSASSVENSSCVAVAWGYHSKAKGVLGSYLVFADWIEEESYWNRTLWTLNGAKMVQVDGEKIKPDVWYTMKNGEVAEAEDD